MSASSVQTDARVCQRTDASVSQSALANPIRVLAALASYGNKNEKYLSRVIEEYRSMPYKVHLIVLSNIPRDLGPDVEVRVGLPEKNPWSLPFAHKQLFAERIDDYDLFIYSEDDILITTRNLEAFRAASRTLPDDVIAGFVRFETGNDGALYFDPLCSHFHWDPASVRSVGDYTFAFYTNEHSASYVLTHEQLKRAIRSGGFLLAPYEGRYDMLCTAATDPYTRCGFRKMICISHLEDFSVHHLPNNKHTVRPYRASSVFHRQIEALFKLKQNGRSRSLLFDPETKVLNAKWSKDYYEPVREDVISLIPANARNVLSLGCGWGATERRLVEQGRRVVGIPMDSVIGACSEDAGVEMVYGDFATAHRKLQQDRFDCILLLNVLHLVPEPVGVLSSLAKLLAPGGVVLIATPNFANLVTYWRRLTGDSHHKQLGSYEKSGIHLTSRCVIGKWLKQCGIALVASREVVFERAQLIQHASLGLLGKWLACELMIVGRLSK